jgi:nitroreductase
LHFDSFAGTGMLGVHNVEHEEGSMSELIERDTADDSWLDMESIDHVMSTARSVRRKLDFERVVEPELLFDCINIATQAPTGIYGENWRFLVVTDAAKKQQIAELYCAVITAMQRERGLQIKPAQQALMSRLHEIPAMIFVCYIGDAPGSEISEQVGFYGSILPAAWSLMLALRSRKLGSTWTSLLASHQEEVGAILGIPQGVVQTVMLPVGYMKDAKLRKAARKDARQVTYWNQWDEQPAER